MTMFNYSFELVFMQFASHVLSFCLTTYCLHFRLLVLLWPDFWIIARLQELVSV